MEQETALFGQELADQRLTKQSMVLLEKIGEELNPSDFTWSEIKQEFDHLGANGFSRRHFDWLIEEGLIAEDSEQKGHYSLTLAGNSVYEAKTDRFGTPKGHPR